MRQDTQFKLLLLAATMASAVVAFAPPMLPQRPTRSYLLEAANGDNGGVNGIAPSLAAASKSPTSNGKSTPKSTKSPPKPVDLSKLGDWEELHGNWVLRPPPSDDPPRALLHFLGGALVGASPHITYRYMLERLATQNYIVVATPFNLSFDHLETCDQVIHKFENMAPTIAREYGALPVVGIGHSLGALLQLLITSLFPDTPRAANALISFNNKPIGDAVPFFDEVFAPLFTAIASKNSTVPSGNEALALSLKVAKSAANGRVPSDEVLTELSKVLTPPGFPSPFGNTGVAVSKDIREALENIISPSATALSDAGVLQLFNEAVTSLEQIPMLIDEVADGARDFMPTPASVRTAARKTYRARRTLIIGFSDDAIDESDKIEELLVEARSVTRMKRPMVEIDLQRRTLEGGHATPLLAPPLDLAGKAEDLLGSETAKERLLYAQTDATVDELSRWLEEGNL